MAHSAHIESNNPIDRLQSCKIADQHIEVQQEVLATAQDANNQEHELSLLQAIKLYPKAVGWSILLSTALVMEGYDTKLIASLFAQPAFQEAYGIQQEDSSYQIPASWQAGLTNGSACGQVFGLMIAGYITERFGFRKTMISGLSVLMGFIFIQFFAPSLPVLEVAQILMGIPLGIFQTVTTVYAVEVTPTCLRAYLTSYVNLCWIFGQIIASGVLRGVLSREDQWAYRIPFALQWLWPVPLIIGILFAPESPWWLVRQHRLDDAKAALLRLTSRDKISFDVDKSVTLMAITIEHEHETNTGTTYMACFRGTALRRTIIASGCYSIQILSGNGLRSFSTYFFQQAGLPTDQSFNMSIVSYALGIIGVIIVWFMLPKVGRRTLYLWGLISFIFIYLAIGGIGIPQASSPSSALAWAIGGLLLLSVFVYDISLGPVAYSLVSEMPSSLLRSKTVAIARIAYNITNIGSNTITPYQLNPSAWGWSARSAFFWAGTTFLSLVFTYFCVPEPKDRTIADLDILFERKVSARNFAKTQVRLTEIREKKVYA